MTEETALKIAEELHYIDNELSICAGMLLFLVIIMGLMLLCKDMSGRK